jgi:uncharacterized protein YukE
MFIIGGWDTAGELESQAGACDQEAGHLDDMIRDLESRLQRGFQSFHGPAADALESTIQQKVAVIRSARDRLRAAAATLRRDAASAREALRAQQQGGLQA